MERPWCRRGRGGWSYLVHLCAEADSGVCIWRRHASRAAPRRSALLPTPAVAEVSHFLTAEPAVERRPRRPKRLKLDIDGGRANLKNQTPLNRCFSSFLHLCLSLSSLFALFLGLLPRLITQRSREQLRQLRIVWFCADAKHLNQTPVRIRKKRIPCADVEGDQACGRTWRRVAEAH